MDKKINKEVAFNFIMTKDLSDRIEKFAQLIELPFLNIQNGYKSRAVRMLIEDSLNRYLNLRGDEVVCPYADKISEIIPILENIRLRTKLENVPEDISPAEQKALIDNIIKEFH